MRVMLIGAAIAGVMSFAPAEADTITQTATVTNLRDGPAAYNLFDPTLGQLAYVEISGIINYGIEMQRTDSSNLDAVSVPVTETTMFGSTTVVLTGTELIAAGAAVGGASLTGDVDAFYTGSQVAGFIAGSSTVGYVTPTFSAPLAGGVGAPVFSPGSPQASYSLLIKYNFYGVPEPATWAMMLLGFAGIGWVLRRKPLTVRPASVSGV